MNDNQIDVVQKIQALESALVGTVTLPNEDREEPTRGSGWEAPGL